MDTNQLIQLLLACLGALIAAIGGWFVLEFRELRQSVDKLNASLAKVLERLEIHEERLDRLEELRASHQ